MTGKGGWSLKQGAGVKPYHEDERETARVAGVGEKTRERILATAVRLFAERGYHGVSLRHIVAEAEVNLGAVHYHFGSKQALFDAVFAYGARRIVEVRLGLLEGCREGPGRPPLLEQIVTAFLAPGLAGGADHEAIRAFLRIRARLITEDSERARQLLREHFRTNTLRFIEALGRALPDLPPEKLRWRFQTMLATIVYSASNWGAVHSLSDEAGGRADGETTLAHLVPLMAAMFRTPADAVPIDVKTVMDAIGPPAPA